MAITPTTSWAKANLRVTIAFIPLTWITVITRLMVRRKIKGIGIDDWFMLAGVIVYTWYCQTILSAVFNGLGSPDLVLDSYYIQKGRMWFLLAQISYTINIVPVKCSISTALLRITIQRRYRYGLYFIMALSACASLVTVITLLTWCRPVSATWDPSAGTCGDVSIVTSISYFISAVIIVTDWACALLPGFILWGVQMRTRVKISLIVVLSLGVLASSLTIVRLAFLLNYTSADNYLESVAKISIWGTIELGIGIVAGSMATLRPLLKFVPFLSNGSSGPRSTSQRTSNFRLQTFPVKSAPNYEAECFAGDDNHVDPTRSDAESQRHILKATSVVITRESSLGRHKP